jgi:regulator of protease activity HflC (stomatin/prohibitin superfamily)
MIKNKKKIIALVLMVGLVGGSITGCKSYNTPEFVEVSPSQTAFMIPLVGDEANQVKMDSEEAVAKNLVNAKRVEIPKQWVQTGRTQFFFWEQGQWMPTAKVIVVERKPETREWTSTDSTGTSSSNQGIKAESKESIGFTAAMNCTASIQESDAPKFLFNYNDKPLKDVMDSEIRPAVESKFAEECAKRSIDEILAQKEDIMNSVRTYVTDTFAKKGISITQFGLKGDLTYDNKEIQTAIDSQFKAEKDRSAQAIDNEKNKEKAVADAEVIRSQASTLDQQIKLKEAEAKQTEAEAKLEMAKSMAGWKPNVVGNNPFTSFAGIDGTTNK